MERRDGSIKNKVKENIEKSANFFKKIDIFFIGSGIAVFAVASGLGAAIIIGSSITLIPSQMVERWSKKRK